MNQTKKLPTKTSIEVQDSTNDPGTKKAKTDNPKIRGQLETNSSITDGFDQTPCTIALLRRPQVEAITGLARSTIYDLMKRGLFPKPVRIGSRAVAWRGNDIIAWLDSRPEAGEVQP